MENGDHVDPDLLQPTRDTATEVRLEVVLVGLYSFHTHSKVGVSIYLCGIMWNQLSRFMNLDVSPMSMSGTQPKHKYV